VCAVCSGVPDTRGTRDGWEIDHDHTEGIVRGVLCHPCNIDVGRYERGCSAAGVTRLARIADYLGSTVPQKPLLLSMAQRTQREALRPPT
jgi:hypothetical protein